MLANLSPSVFTAGFRPILQLHLHEIASKVLYGTGQGGREEAGWTGRGRVEWLHDALWCIVADCSLRALGHSF